MTDTLKKGKDRVSRSKQWWLFAVFLLSLSAAALSIYFTYVKPTISTYSECRVISITYIVVAGLVILGAALTYLLGTVFRVRLHLVFLAAAMAFGMGYALVFPPATVPDEEIHMNTAYQYSDFFFGERVRVEKKAAVVFRAADAEFENFGTEETLENIGKQYAHIFETCADDTPTVVEVTTLHNYPLLHLFCGMGIALGRLLGLGTVFTALLGKIFNLMFFVGMTTLAIWLMPFGKKILFGVGLLPMTLHLAASYNYDAVILGLSFVTVAYWLRLAFREERVTVRDLLIGCLFNFLLAPCKIVNLLLCFVCLLIPVKKVGSWKKWLLYMLVAIGVAIASVLLIQSAWLGSHVNSGNGHIVSWANEEGYTLQWILQNLSEYRRMLVKTLVRNAGLYFEQMLGSSLSWLNFDLPSYCVYAFGFLLLCCCFRRETEPDCISFRQKLLIVLGTVGYIVLVMTGLLISWTPLSYKIVLGLQGRYFLPILPVSMLLLYGKSVVLRDGSERTLCNVIAGVEAVTLLLAFSTIPLA